MKKRFVATLLALCMLLSIVPTSAFAASLDNDAAQSKQETLANDLTDSAKPDDTQGTPGAPKPDGAATDGQDGAPDTPNTPAKPDADAVPDGAGGADKKDNPDGTDKKGQDKNDQKDVNAVQEGPQQVDASATAYSPQTVYVYTKVTGNTDGLQVNTHGWYTIGTIQLNIPEASFYSEWDKPDNDTSDNPYYLGQTGATTEDIIAAFKNLERHTDNQTIDVSAITWTQLAVEGGATNYEDEAPSSTACWHLDGSINIEESGKILYNYYDTATNLPLTEVSEFLEVAKPGSYTISTSSTYAKSIPGYTCVGVGKDNDNGSYSNSIAVTVNAGQQTTVIFYYTPATYSYTVKYVERGTGTELRNRKTGTLNYDQTQLESAADIQGYKVVDTDAVMISPNNNDITFFYVKDGSQTQPTKYTVKYYKGGVEQPDDMLTVTGTAWVNDDPAKIAIAAGGIPTPADKYTGYKLDPKNGTYPAVGSEVNTGSVFIVNYVKDDTVTKDTKYTVKYTIEGTLQDKDTVVVDGKAWVNDDPAKIAIKDEIAPADKYTGYKLDPQNGTYPAVGSEVNTGSVFTVNYVKDNTQTKTLKYTVNYFKDGVVQTVDKVEKTVEVWVNAPDTIKIQAEIAPAKKYNGYKLDPKNPEYPAVGSEVNTGSVFTVNYVARADLSYTVKYLEKDTDKELAKPKTVGNQTFNTTSDKETAIDIVGYNKVAPTSAEITIGADETKNVITFYYTARTDLTYTVNYLESGTNKPLAPAKVVKNQTFGTEVTERAIFIKGYRRVNPTKETITIGIEENVINFYYKAPGGPRFPQQPGGASSTPNTGALKSPQTGDASNLSLWFALLFVSGGVLMGTAVIGRKRKYNR